MKVQACLLRARTLPASFSLRKHFMQLFFGLSFGQSKENAVYAAVAMRCGEWIEASSPGDALVSGRADNPCR
ncbi:hypothetical protein [Xanthomonas vasicola]|uniref:hypothetical protein n=1 Tax=Xanthomonas vasicola TaxID=56459 RepID=UPI0012FD173F|nr:hypothetical protein [Xanthomonas vasicola]MBV7305641.1 hypothetical protein [Xanthomonas vasicola pv. vasculorum]